MPVWKEVDTVAAAPGWMSTRAEHFVPLPAWQREPIELVLRDMWAGRPVSICFGFELDYTEALIPGIDWPDAGGVLWAWVDGERVAYGTPLAAQASLAERAVALADWLLELVTQSRAAWSEARPPCPGHRHPALPALMDGEAWWICPRSSDKLGEIGRSVNWRCLG